MDPLTYGGSFTLERVLGTVPVEADGSAAMRTARLASRVLRRPGRERPGRQADAELHRPCSRAKSPVASAATSSARETSPAARHAAWPCGRHAQPHRADRRLPRRVRFPPRHPADPRPACASIATAARRPPAAGRMRASVLLTGDRGPMFSHAYVTMTVRRLFSDNRNQPRSNYPPRALGSSASRILTMLDGSHYGVRADCASAEDAAAVDRRGRPVSRHLRRLGLRLDRRLLRRTSRSTPTGTGPRPAPAAEVIDRRCASCHQGANVLPRALSDERNVSFWRFDADDPGLRMSRHLVFNLTRPEKSLLAAGPAGRARPAAGACAATCRAGRPTSSPRPHDPDYRKLAGDGRGGQGRTSRRSSVSTCPASAPRRSIFAR